VSDESALPSAEAYERAGRQAAIAVRGYSSVLVVSDDPIAAANVAIGVARAEAEHRSVVVADLVGDLAPIQSLVGNEDAHGIYDSFVFGTSLDKVIQDVEGEKNLEVITGGTESPATAEILGSRRWQRIASDFAGTDALLLLVASSISPALDKLAAQLDGLLVVGDTSLENAPNAVLLARVPHPEPPAVPRKTVAPITIAEGWWRSRTVVLAGTLLIVVIAAVLLLKPGGSRRIVARAPDTVILPDSPQRDSTTMVRHQAMLPANPADSATAATFAVEILAANTAEGANFELQRHGAMMPAATISLVPIGDTEAIWYKVMAGAFTDSAQAERLLASLRRRKIVSDSAGTVVRTPFALRVDSVPSQAAALAKVREKLQGFSTRGLAVYALTQSDGSARLYAGAFETPEQSSLAATALRVAGLTPVLEYRTGRVQ
jgi:SPOR domain